MAMIFSRAAAHPVVQAALKQRANTNTLMEMSFAPDLLLKQVSSLQEAIDCGGVLLIWARQGSSWQALWQMLSGDVLHAALKRGGVDALCDVEDLRLVSRARYVSGWVKPDANTSAYSARATAVDHIPVGGGMLRKRVDLNTTDVLVLGVVTKGHGRGMGPVGSGYGTTCRLEQLSEFGTADIRPIVVKGLHEIEDYPAIVHQYCLSTRIRVSEDAAKYMIAHKAQIIAKWVELGAPDEDIMAVYRSSYDAAVASAFPVKTPLDIYVTYYGEGATVAETYGVVGIPFGKSVAQSLLYSGGPTNVAMTAKQSEDSGERVYHDFGFGASACGLMNVVPAGGTLARALGSDIVMGDVRFDQRESMGSCLPAVALAFILQPGEVDYTEIIDRLTELRAADNYFAVPSTLTDPGQQEAYAKSAMQASSFASHADVRGFLGPYIGHMLRFGAAWDREAAAQG